MTEGHVLLRAPAKVNLFLRILGREEDGYHQLETLFQTIHLADTLEMERHGEEIDLRVVGADVGPISENLVFRAASAFRTAAGVGGEEGSGVRIRLEKRIPAGAGLGGGSSDAATTLRGMNHLFGDPLAPEALLALARELGSDVPFFLSPSPLALAWGRGDRILPLPAFPPAPVLLALPAIGVDTGEAYRALAAAAQPGSEVKRDRERGVILPPGFPRDWNAVAAQAGNDFEPVVFALHPMLGELRRALAETDPLFSLLSGSGGALFALYQDDDEAGEALRALAPRFPDVRFLLTHTAEASPDPA